MNGGSKGSGGHSRTLNSKILTRPKFESDPGSQSDSNSE